MRLADAVRSFERSYIVRCLEEAAGCRGISRKSLWKKMRDYGIEDAELSRDGRPSPRQ